MHIAIGIDVSKNKLDLCWLRDPLTNKKKSKTFKNQPTELNNISNWIRKHTGTEPQDVLVTVEPTGIYHEALIYHLHAQGFNIFAPNPSRVHAYMKAEGIVHKTDKSDAAVLARYGLQTNKRKLWQPEAPKIRALRAMLRRLDALEADRIRELNRLEASMISGSSERVIQSLKEMIRVLEAEIQALQDDIDDHIDQTPELKKNRKLLRSIPGIGPVLSRELVYLLTAKPFLTAKQIACYVGVIPRIQQSGKWEGHTRLSKEGPSRLRAKLYMAAIVAKQHNPIIRDQYDRLLVAGKKKMQALGAAMRKLLHICFGVVKHQQEFQPQPL